MSYTIHKFGGSSLADTQKLEHVFKIIKEQHSQKTAVVLSAMGGVTNDLVQICQLATKQQAKALEIAQSLKEKFRQVSHEFLKEDFQKKYFSQIESDFNDLSDLVKSASIVGELSEQNDNFISGLGEIWTSLLMHNKLKQESLNSQWLDARKVLVVKDSNLGKIYSSSESKRLLDEALEDSDFLIITGFVARSSEGASTTLGRNGSDYSASIFGNLLNAQSIQIWTDVDGVMSADPRLVPEAQVIEELTYQEATELAYFGAKVVHLKTMLPALEKNIPIWIKNTFNPTAQGTRIADKCLKKSPSPVKGFATVNQVAIVNVEGRGMIGVPGIAGRLFNSLNENDISVILISQASSEYSICFAVPESQAEQAKKCTESIFFAELQQGKIERVEIERQCSILAAVGDQMVGSIGLSAQLFSALGKSGTNIRAIAQGSSERNISILVKESESAKALRAVHSAFYLSDQSISLGLIGPGTVGSAFLKQLQSEIEELRNQYNLDIRVRALCNSKKMLLHPKNISLKDWKKSLDNDAVPLNLEDFCQHVQADFIPHSVIVDCTTSEEVAAQYKDWLHKGIHVITPNKKAATFPIDQYHQLKETRKSMTGHFLYETTVGAGLPIIGTLRDLLQTGDEIIEIEGVLSGTLAYLFYHFDGSRPFSEIVLEAKKKGFTEPDPRDDLSGMDIVRKVVILAREIGLNLEVEKVSVDSLVPSELQDTSIENFLKGLPQTDAIYAEKIKTAQAENKILRYVGIINPQGESKVELRSYDKSHPFSRIKATDNIVAFKTKRYNEQPLIVQGPGAGPEVTAAGIFADLLRIARYAGARL